MMRAVLDASVIIKWYLFDEAYGEKALTLLKRFTMGGMDIIAPALLIYELMNGLLIACRRGRLDKNTLASSLEGFMNLDIRLVDVSSDYERVIHYCHVYERSVYDSCYLALAEQEEINLITADERLFNRVGKELTWVTWIGNIEQVMGIRS